MDYCSRFLQYQSIDCKMYSFIHKNLALKDFIRILLFLLPSPVTLFYLNCFHLKMLIRLQSLLTMCKMVPIFVIIGTGVYVLATGQFSNIYVWRPSVVSRGGGHLPCMSEVQGLNPTSDSCLLLLSAGLQSLVRM